MNPTGEIISIGTCLRAKVLMINKMNRTGQEFPGCLRSEWWVSQYVAGLPAAWGPEPTDQRCTMKGENMGHWKGNVSFLPLEIGKSSNVGLICSCPILFFFNLRKTSKSMLPFKNLWKGIFKKKDKRRIQKVPPANPYKSQLKDFILICSFFPLNLKVMHVYCRKKKWKI